MHILFLTQIVPYPPDAGPKVKTWHVLRYLVQAGHRVTLATFYRAEEAPHLEVLRGLCHEVIPVPIKRSRLADVFYLLKSNLSGRPFLVERDDLPAMRDAVRRVIDRGDVDVIHADQLTMAQFAFPPAEGAPWPTTVFDAHNAVWTIVQRTQESASPLLRPVLALEASRVRRHEGEILAQFDHVLAVSEIDKRALLETLPEEASASAVAEKIVVIPIAVDAGELQPVQRQAGSRNIFTMGTLHYPPNADGIRWFAKEVFPLVREKIPEATLTIVGKNPPADFLQMAEKNPQSVIVTGYVPDLTPYFKGAAMLVVPVRAGGGIRVRILEAFARAMPVVTTTVGLEGIEARPGVDVLVEDDARSFAEAVITLMNDPALQAQLARNGRRLAEEKYDWQVVLKAMEQVYPQA
jgi:glycosyltransferase involved in cell wall biosynthesis